MFNALSGAVFVTAAQSLFGNRLLATLKGTAPGIDAVKVLQTGATQIRQVFEGQDLATVLGVYMVGIKDVFAFSLAAAAFTVIITVIIPVKRLPPHPKEKGAASGILVA